MKYYSPFPSLSVSQYNYCYYVFIYVRLSVYTSIDFVLSTRPSLFSLCLYYYFSFVLHLTFIITPFYLWNTGFVTGLATPPPHPPPPHPLKAFGDMKIWGTPHHQPLKSIWKFFAKLGFSLKRKTFLQNVQKNWKRCLTSRFNVWNVNTVWFLKLSGFIFCYPKTQRGLFHRFLK